MRNWDVAVKVGDLHSRYTVFSPSFWVRGVFNRWRLETPDLATEVPLRYEVAFGGAGADGQDAWDENPVGIGYFQDLDMQSRNSIPAPQILEFGNDLPDRPTQLRTIAPCPVSVGWLPRRSLAGTFDDGWKKTRWPLFPKDSSDLFFCAAPASLRFPGFLQGDECIVLDGFTHDANICSKLPGGIAPVLIIPGENGQVFWSRFVLDTLVINPEKRSVAATWRACVFAPKQECQAIVLRNPVRGMPHA